ncbi:MAG: adenylate kinase [Zhenhengia sp.]|uniref:adenylate kinase n=1 Tax=Zhenhengia sp. TaxID=2944208 RepID=UPI0039939BDB
MIILIMGASHTGKTVLAQKILEKYNITYLSIDHLKMGLIRSGNTQLTPEDDEELVSYLWPIVKEIIKTAIENQQNLVVEGVYIPFDWKNDFDNEYLKEIQSYCLIMTKEYIEKHFSAIKKYANTIESRLDDSYCTIESMIEENVENLQMCKKYDCNYILIEDEYKVDIDL